MLQVEDNFWDENGQVIPLSPNDLHGKAFEVMKREREIISNPEYALQTYAYWGVYHKLTDNQQVITVLHVERDEVNRFEFTRAQILNAFHAAKDVPKVDKKFRDDILAGFVDAQLGPRYLYDAHNNRHYLFADGRFSQYSKEGLITQLLPLVKPRARVEGVKALSEGMWRGVLRELQHKRLTNFTGRPPQWWNGKPVVDSESWQDANNIFVVKNGLLNPVAMANGEQSFWLGRTPYLFHQFASEVEFTDATEHPNWTRYLDGLEFEDDELRNFQEAMGVAVLPGYQGHDIVLLEGWGGTGKGVACGTVQDLAGTYGMARTMSQAGRDFGQADMQGKTVYIIPEAETEQQKQLKEFVALLKAISGRDRMEADVKYSTQYGEITHHPTPFLNTNELIKKLQDRHNALTRRLNAILFHHIHENPDTKLREKLQPELPAILNWCLQGFIRVYNRGCFDLPASSLRVLGQIQKQAFPLTDFVAEKLTLDANSWVKVSDVYASYEDWARENCANVIRRMDFPRELCATIPDLPEKKQHEFTQDNGRKSNCQAFRGIKLKDLTLEARTNEQSK